jgi:hypothetical protein
MFNTSFQQAERGDLKSFANHGLRRASRASTLGMRWGKLLDSWLLPRNPSLCNQSPQREASKHGERNKSGTGVVIPTWSIDSCPLAPLSISARPNLGYVSYLTSLTWNFMCQTVAKRMTDRDKKRISEDRKAL